MSHPTVTLPLDDLEAVKTFIAIAIMLVVLLAAGEAWPDSNKRRRRK